MRVLFAASEVAPIIKLGGLGDVAGALPKALQKIGVNIDVIVPYFPIAKTENLPLTKVADLHVPFGQDTHTLEVFQTKLPDSDVDVIMLKNDDIFSTGGQDAFKNNLSETEMFSFFDRAVVEFLKSRLNTYDIVHCNDWHTAMITHILDDELESDRPATLFTIHNLLYQGIGDLELLSDLGINPGDHRIIQWDLRDNDLNLMYEGVTSSDFLNTVSPTYAKEILTEEFARDMSAVLQDREGRLTGILNGIDTSHFPRYYDVSSVSEEKSKLKHELQEKMGLEVCDKPIFSFISRLDPNQKGLDILFEAIPEIVAKGGQFILLGTGDKEWEDKFKALAEEMAGDGAVEADTGGSEVAASSDSAESPTPENRVGAAPATTSAGNSTSINIAFDVKLANLIYAGSDYLLVPSRYEPCGLIQMIAMWFGTLPVVHAVGGLKDSVDEGETGFTFEKYSSSDLLHAVDNALEVYKRPVDFTQMQRNAMNKDFSWEKSAKEYKDLYERIIKLREKSVELAEPDF